MSVRLLFATRRVSTCADHASRCMSAQYVKAQRRAIRTKKDLKYWSDVALAPLSLVPGWSPFLSAYGIAFDA